MRVYGVRVTLAGLMHEAYTCAAASCRLLDSAVVPVRLYGLRKPLISARVGLQLRQVTGYGAI